MYESIIEKLKIKNSKLGYAKLSDNSVIILRVAVVDVRPREETSPFGVDFEVNATTGVSAYPSKEAMKKVKDKPIIEPGRTLSEGWERLDIVEKKSAYEEVEFTGETLGAYLIRVEVEPIMASMNITVRTVKNEPVYTVKWVPKVAWKKIYTED